MSIKIGDLVRTSDSNILNFIEPFPLGKKNSDWSWKRDVMIITKVIKCKTTGSVLCKVMFPCGMTETLHDWQLIKL